MSQVKREAARRRNIRQEAELNIEYYRAYCNLCEHAESEHADGPGVRVCLVKNCACQSFMEIEI